MNICDCYRVGTRFRSNPFWSYNEAEQYSYCMGTKEREECSCGGNRTKCDFYQHVREKALKDTSSCHLCDGHQGCDNCYYGQVDSKMPHSHCEDCESLKDGVMTGWESLGDNYCRNCGRKLK